MYVLLLKISRFKHLFKTNAALEASWKFDKVIKVNMSPSSLSTLEDQSLQLPNQVPWKVLKIHSIFCPGLGLRNRIRIRGDSNVQEIKQDFLTFLTIGLRFSKINNWLKWTVIILIRKKTCLSYRRNIIYIHIYIGHCLHCQQTKWKIYCMTFNKYLIIVIC